MVRRDGAACLREGGRGVVSHDKLLIDVEGLSGRDCMRGGGGPTGITEIQISAKHRGVTESLHPVGVQRRTDIGIEDPPARNGDRIGYNKSAAVEIDCPSPPEWIPIPQVQRPVGADLAAAAYGELPGPV